VREIERFGTMIFRVITRRHKLRRQIRLPPKLEGLILRTNSTTTGRLPGGQKLLAFFLLSSLGCSHELYSGPGSLAQRILPPLSLSTHQDLASPSKMAHESADWNSPGQAPEFAHAEADPPQAKTPAPPQANGGSCQPGQTLTLPDAIAMAFQLQPRLRASLES